MIKLNLQLFGNGKSGPSLGGGSGKKVNIISQTDVWTYRHREQNEPFVDSINGSVRTIQEDFPGIMDDVQQVNSAVLGGKDRTDTLGFYNNGTGQLALNANYTNVQKMNSVYDESVKSGYHPSRGGKNGTEAVTFHEMGHALTAYYGKKDGGSGDIDAAAKKIVDRAYRKSNGTGGTLAWAKKISGYAAESNAECVAEAVCDWYCNGNNASKASKAIMAELRRYK